MIFMEDTKQKLGINPLFIEGNEDLPTITLNHLDKVFEFKGRSLPEDVSEFYNPVIQWIQYYKKKITGENIIFDFKLDYMNSGSYKMIFSIVKELQDMYHKGNTILVRWHYYAEDDDMRDEGKGFAERLNVPFEFIRYTD